MQPLIQPSIEYDIAEAIFTAFPFVTLVVYTPQQAPQVCHLPVYFNKASNCFDCHLSKANPVVALLATEDCQAQLIFLAEHGYVSPTWSEDIRVPTWDYCAVHVHGKLKVLNDHEQKRASMARQVAALESHWQVDALDESTSQRLFSAIAVLQLEIARCDYRYKLSQAKSSKAKAALISRFDHSGNQALVQRYQQVWQS